MNQKDLVQLQLCSVFFSSSILGYTEVVTNLDPNRLKCSIDDALAYFILFLMNVLTISQFVCKVRRNNGCNRTYALR